MDFNRIVEISYGLRCIEEEKYLVLFFTLAWTLCLHLGVQFN